MRGAPWFLGVGGRPRMQITQSCVRNHAVPDALAALSLSAAWTVARQHRGSDGCQGLTSVSYTERGPSSGRHGRCQDARHVPPYAPHDPRRRRGGGRRHSSRRGRRSPHGRGMATARERHAEAAPQRFGYQRRRHPPRCGGEHSSDLLSHGGPARSGPSPCVRTGEPERARGARERWCPEVVGSAQDRSAPLAATAAEHDLLHLEPGPDHAPALVGAMTGRPPQRLDRHTPPAGDPA